ncbi:MAG: hypothetical protein RLZZ450_847 [Pseudomonadota bacterium]|jgi:hypothetical protein
MRTSLSWRSIYVVTLVATLGTSCADVSDVAPSGPDSVRSAIDATGLTARSIRLVDLHGIEQAMRSAYFDTKVNSVPQQTPDGGAFQYFQGSIGLGAIYSYTQTNGAVDTHPIYGDILSTWSALGWETRLGYPRSDEMPAEDRSADTPCLSTGGVRQQLFGDVSWEISDAYGGGEVVLCWSPSHGTRVLPAELERALNSPEGSVYRVDI